MSHVETLPHNLEAERSVLGAMLVNNEHFYPVSERLSAEDFYLDAHRHIFRAMLDLMESVRGFDLLTLQEQLLTAGQIEAAGGMAYLVRLTDGVPYLSQLDHHLTILKEYSLRRQMMQTANRMLTQCLDTTESAEAILGRVEQQILELAHGHVVSDFVSLDELQTPTAQLLERLYTERNLITGMATGFGDLDRLTSGFQPGDLVVLAARPSMGKTAMALNIAAQVAVRDARPVGVFSLEMSKEQLLLRLLCAEARVDAHRLRSGYLGRDDYTRLVESLSHIAPAPLFIDETSTMTLLEMRTKTRRLQAEHGLGLLIVDYLQLMSGGGRENRVQEISAISRGLKALAKELRIPVLALSQLSRAPEQRTGDHRPMLSDLRESGSIEQDADTVMFIYREEVYNPTDENQGLADLIIAKQRNGPTGVVRLVFLRQFTKFENMFTGNA